MIKLSNFTKSEKWRIYTSTKSSHINTLLPNSTTQRKGDLMILLLKVWSTIADLQSHPSRLVPI